MAGAACSRALQLFAQVAVAAVRALPPSAGLTSVLLSHSTSYWVPSARVQHCPTPRNSRPRELLTGPVSTRRDGQPGRPGCRQRVIGRVLSATLYHPAGSVGRRAESRKWVTRGVTGIEPIDFAAAY